MLPQGCTRLRLAGKAGECVHQRTLFRDVLIEKPANAAQSTEGECKDVEDQTKWKCDHPPQCCEKISHFFRSQVRRVLLAGNLPSEYALRKSRSEERRVGKEGE